ncbi:MAG: hypothetical protein AAF414_24550, partial [Pseudomonadota bacterium]
MGILGRNLKAGRQLTSVALVRTACARYAGFMQIMIWIGAVLTVLGLAGLVWCIRKAAWLKRVQAQDDRPDN